MSAVIAVEDQKKVAPGSRGNYDPQFFLAWNKMPPTLGIMAIFRDEDQIMHEWVDHHKREGITEFLLINHQSRDGGEQRARALGCTVRDWALDPSPGVCPQDLAYQHFLPEMRSDWVVLIDLDEFLYSSATFSIPQILASIGPLTSQLTVNWRNFGSSARLRQPVSVIASFTKRDAQCTGKFLSKTIARRRHILVARHHHCSVKGETRPAPPGLHLNHYRIQSREWYMRVKMIRGDATRTQAQLLIELPELYKCSANFRRCDRGRVSDVVLKNKRGSWRARRLPRDRRWPDYGAQLIQEIAARDSLISENPPKTRNSDNARRVRGKKQRREKRLRKKQQREKRLRKKQKREKRQRKKLQREKRQRREKQMSGLRRRGS